MAETNRAISVEVEVNVEPAIKGLKALQREAKEATRVLRDLETQMQRMNGGASE